MLCICGLADRLARGEWLLQRFIYENPAFAIHHLDIQTDGVLSIEQLRHWAGVKLNDNLWALDLTRVKRDLEFMPIIASAESERVLPHTLRIRITERQPIAQYNFPQTRANGVQENGIYLLDAQGFVMFPLQPHQRSVPAATNEHLPTFIGLAVTELSPGRKVLLPQVQAGLQLIESFVRSPMAGRAELKEIDVGQPGVLQVATAQGSSISFGMSDMDGQIRRWHAIHEYGQKSGKHLAAADLSVSNNIPTRWIEATLAPLAPPPKPIPTLRNRKKNV